MCVASKPMMGHWWLLQMAMVVLEWSGHFDCPLIELWSGVLATNTINCYQMLLRLFARSVVLELSGAVLELSRDVLAVVLLAELSCVLLNLRFCVFVPSVRG
ncbi:hypothetical protein U1Q18_007773 [Sarracenia purpurea var. burkii]